MMQHASLLSHRPAMNHHDGSSRQRDGKVRVVLVDDHALVRQGLRAVLESHEDIEIVGEAGNGMEATKTVKELRPQVVIMDINMPCTNGIDATEAIRSKYPETMIIGLSTNADDTTKNAMTRAGAWGIIAKDVAVEELYRAIKEAAANLSPLS
jgi:DNA-binding NarL/FixJ family response regulator